MSVYDPGVTGARPDLLVTPQEPRRRSVWGQAVARDDHETYSQCVGQDPMPAADAERWTAAWRQRSHDEHPRTCRHRLHYATLISADDTNDAALAFSALDANPNMDNVFRSHIWFIYGGAARRAQRLRRTTRLHLRSVSPAHCSKRRCIVRYRQNLRVTAASLGWTSASGPMRSPVAHRAPPYREYSACEAPDRASVQPVIEKEQSMSDVGEHIFIWLISAIRHEQYG